MVSCAQNGSIKIWDLTGDTCTHELVPEEDVAVRSVSIASDGSMLVAANSQVSQLYMNEYIHHISVSFVGTLFYMENYGWY